MIAFRCFITTTNDTSQGRERHLQQPSPRITSLSLLTAMDQEVVGAIRVLLRHANQHGVEESEFPALWVTLQNSVHSYIAVDTSRPSPGSDAHVDLDNGAADVARPTTQKTRYGCWGCHEYSTTRCALTQVTLITAPTPTST